MWGKVQPLYGHGQRAITCGLARAHGMYQQGVHIDGKMNDVYQIGKRVAATALPHMDQYMPGMHQSGVKAIGQIGAARALR